MNGSYLFLAAPVACNLRGLVGALAIFGLVDRDRGRRLALDVPCRLLLRDALFTGTTAYQMDSGLS